MPAPVKLSPPKKPPLKPGRPCLLTKPREAILLKAIEAAMPLKHAAMLAGISYDTLNRWRIKGESELARPEFRDFCKSLRRSEAVAMQRLVTVVREAGEKDWKAATWMLERRFPDEFAKPQHVEHSGPKGQPIQTFTTVEPEVLQRMKRQVGLQQLVGKLGGILLKHKEASDLEKQHGTVAKHSTRLRE